MLTHFIREMFLQKKDAGEKILLMIFGGREETLNKFLSKFCEKVATSTEVVTPESLCPSADAADLYYDTFFLTCIIDNLKIY